MSRVKKITLISGIVISGLLIFIMGSIGYTSRPEFCRTCHYMVPFYDGWKESSHSDVSCTVCHFEPGIAGTVRGKVEGLLQVGKYITKTYKKSKPWAEIPDASCLRDGCHIERLLDGQVEFKEGIVFDHSPHLMQLRRGKKLRCTSCHSQIVQGDHITVTEESCFLCHFKGEQEGKDLSECKLCHKKEFMLSDRVELSYDHREIFEKEYGCKQCHTNIVIGDGAVHLETCYSCHFEPERLEKIVEIDLLHKVHITDHKIECMQCHLTIQHKVIKTATLSGEDCSSCHVDLHKAQVTLFSGQIDGHEVLPNPMQEIGLNCRGCHIFHEKAGGFNQETFYAKGKSCERCHGEGYGHLFENWESFADKRLKRIDREFDRAKSIIQDSKSTGKFTKEAESLLIEAKRMADIVRIGKGVHNIRFSDELLNSAHDKLQESLSLVGSELHLERYESSEQFIPSDCISCHSDVVESTVEVFNLRYSHEKHIVKAQLECRKCHSNVKRHGELKLRKEVCLDCHHTQEEKECGYCHETQRRLYDGTLTDFPDISADVMAESGIECDDCHRNGNGKIIHPGEEECAECHDEGYGDMVVEWQEENSMRLEELRGLINALNNSNLQDDDKVVLDKAVRVMGIVMEDGSWGAHNFIYLGELLEDSIQGLKKLSADKESDLSTR